MEVNKIICGDNVEVMKTFPDNHFSSIVTDPPYGLKFMGKKWDYEVPSVETWEEALRVLKPGGHLLSFGGTRTYHRMVCNIEDAGFEIMPMCGWLYGSGFPKSQNVGKMVDKIQGNEREEYLADIAYPDSDCWGVPNRNKGSKSTIWQENGKELGQGGKVKRSKGNSPFEGFGTALKPAMEPICMARKPIEKGLTIAGNCLKWGTGGLNIDECRVGTDEIKEATQEGGGKFAMWNKDGDNKGFIRHNGNGTSNPQGRFPANLIIDDSECVKALFPDTKQGKASDYNWESSPNASIPAGCAGGTIKSGVHFGDSGSAARFFYCAKPSKLEKAKYNKHPTVKPISLMKYLIRLVTPPGGILLDNFSGSGSTLVAVIEEGFEYVGIDEDPESCKTANQRILNAQPQLF